MNNDPQTQNALPGQNGLQSFITTSSPQPGIDGQFTPWVIAWRQTRGALGPGILIQNIDYSISVTYCGGDPLTQQDIWNLWPYQGEPRFNYWEAWTDDVTSSGNWTDTWMGLGPIFYSSLTSGKIEIIGAAGWYPIAGLDNVGNGWGRGGDNLSSPMSGNLLSTMAPPTLPQPVGGMIIRTMTVTWTPCSNSGHVENTTVTYDPQNGPQ